jgi:Fis family transcriptional regulator, factor for inversion stimulation protein
MLETGRISGLLVKPQPPIDEAVKSSLERYFQSLEGAPASQVYDMVIKAVERPMLQVIMQRVDGNQLRASEILGINRNTLRKKLKAHGMIQKSLPNS